jgi:hypothetical protein
MRTNLEYGPWEIHPHVVAPALPKEPVAHPEMRCMETMYEGAVTYLKFWNFWVRAGTPATESADVFFHNYENGSGPVLDLIGAVGAATRWPRTEEEVWERISTVWSWLAANVRVDGAAYAALTAADRLVWAACFSKAHLFALLLGRVLPRWHVLIASAHHTEGGAPPTASHVYVGVYLTDRWYYLDPTAVYSGPLPDFPKRRSVGAFKKVDYQHPFQAIPVPLSPLNKVPHLPA